MVSLSPIALIPWNGMSTLLLVAVPLLRIPVVGIYLSDQVFRVNNSQSTDCWLWLTPVGKGWVSGDRRDQLCRCAIDSCR